MANTNELTFQFGTRTNCAGQGCPERKSCRRYTTRVPTKKVLVGEQEVQVLHWASLDIERTLLGGDCPAKLERSHAQ